MTQAREPQPADTTTRARGARDSIPRHPLAPSLIAMWLAAIACGIALGVGWAPWLAALPAGGAGAAHWLVQARFRSWRSRLEASIRATGPAAPDAGESELTGGEDAAPDAPEPRAEPRASEVAHAGGDGEGPIEDGRLRRVLDAVDEPVITLGSNGSVLLVNAAAQSLLGARATLDQDSTLLEDLLPNPEILELYSAALRGRPARGRVRLSRSDAGLRIYDVVASPLPAGARGDAPARGVVVCLRDTTELATAVQLKTDFVANASHELRTPLSSIRAAGETLTDFGASDPGMIGRMAEMISGNVTRLEALIADLLDLSRIESPDAPVEIERVDLPAIAAELVELFASVCDERRVAIRVEIDPSLAGMRTSRRLLEVSVKNLLDNALKFAETGTDVSLRARVTPATAREPGDRHAGWRGARIEVIDRGIGIPLDQQARVFERFHQVDPSRTGSPKRRGTGLGLAIVKHAIRKLGGAVGVESVWQQGSTFWIELPTCVPPRQEDDRSTAAPNATSEPG